MPGYKPFIILKNEVRIDNKFNKRRSFKPQVKDENQVAKTPKPFHQEKLETAFRLLNIDRRKRVNDRNLNQRVARLASLWLIGSCKRTSFELTELISMTNTYNFAGTDCSVLVA